MSFQNVLLYSASIPSYEDEDKEDEWDDKWDMNNPENFTNKDDEEYVR